MESTIVLSDRAKIEQILALIALYTPRGGLLRMRLGS
jgi:hypothetical protein